MFSGVVLLVGSDEKGKVVVVGTSAGAHTLNSRILAGGCKSCSISHRGLDYGGIACVAIAGSLVANGYYKEACAAAGIGAVSLAVIRPWICKRAADNAKLEKQRKLAEERENFLQACERSESPVIKGFAYLVRSGRGFEKTLEDLEEAMKNIYG